MERLFRSQVDFLDAVKIHNWWGVFVLHLMHSIPFKAEFMQSSASVHFPYCSAGKHGSGIMERWDAIRTSWQSATFKLAAQPLVQLGGLLRVLGPWPGACLVVQVCLEDCSKEAHIRWVLEVLRGSGVVWFARDGWFAIRFIVSYS